MPKKLCNFSGCHNIIAGNEKYCDEHKIVMDQYRKQKFKHRRSKMNFIENKLDRFYSTKNWEKIKDIVKIKQFKFDIYDYMTKGIINYAQRYHHIIELREDFQRGLDPSNIIGLTERNHQIIHGLYNKNEQIKKETQTFLFKILEDFYKQISNNTPGGG